MLVGKAINAARELRETVKDVKDSVKGAVKGVVTLFQKGHAVVSKIVDFNKSMAEKNKKKKEEKKQKAIEDHKKQKELDKNKEGTQQ